MRRRYSLAFGGVAAAGWPGIASAQHTAKSPIIGFMGAGTPEGWKDWTSAFQQRMRELGWVEGRNLWMEYGWAEGNADRYAEIANEFAKLKVDIIVTVGGDAAKRATSTIPIVVAMMPDPVGRASLQAWRGQAATLPAFRSGPMIWPANGSNSCGKSFRTFAVLQSSPVEAIPRTCWN